MSKGYVAPRTPAANQVAASQNKAFDGCYIYVEGNSDVSFWKNFCSKSSTKIVACNGWPEVVESVNKAIDQGVKCIGIVDRDFYDYINEPKKEVEGVFMTDDHDLEMMIYHSGDYEKVINSWDPGNKVQAYEEAHNIILFDEVKAIVDKIARFKIAVKKHGLNLCFRHQNKKHEIVYPDYDNLLSKKYNYISDDHMIEYIIGWSANNVKGKPSDYQTTSPLVAAEAGVEYDEWKILNGHDFTLLMYTLLKKKINIGLKQTISSEDLERQLYISFEKDSLKATDMYTSIDNYSRLKEYKIFNFE